MSLMCLLYVNLRSRESRSIYFLVVCFWRLCPFMQFAMNLVMLYTQCPVPCTCLVLHWMYMLVVAMVFFVIICSVCLFCSPTFTIPSDLWKDSYLIRNIVKECKFSFSDIMLVKLNVVITRWHFRSNFLTTTILVTLLIVILIRTVIFR